jgi:hypothetical protein
MSKYSPKHNILFYFFVIEQDVIDFLRKEAKYRNLTHNGDEQIYSHLNMPKAHSDKYIGIIIELESQLYFAPLTHDGDKNWFNRQESSDFEIIYDRNNHYVGSILLCKGLPLTTNLVKRLKISEIEANEGKKYADLCADELRYLNTTKIHEKIQTKMRDCIYGKDSPCKHFRVNYELIVKNVKKYNELKQHEQTTNKERI